MRVFRLIEHGRVAIVHVDILIVIRKDISDRLCMDLNRMVPVKTLGELKRYGGNDLSTDFRGRMNQISRRMMRLKTGRFVN